ncbi:hypothetical protein PI23P_00845 [Polaribacter irgensii 23-P]|uniref:Uncharacterized protein n=1 Tax=Polaribacter irgensii 23-P TaxID=313594 RepID=A4C2A6_9FLAO|nr:hypothetical protein [Polaribacter irgensii]EAR11707.1 hypothetical protein PI23P_00845 [Polaribacter irgensii 23-P]
MKKNDNFQYVLTINQWVIIEFFKAKQFNLERSKELKGKHYFILTLIVKLYLNKNLINKTFKGSVYTLMGNTLFYDNLPLTFVKKAKIVKEKKREDLSLKRNLQNYLKRLIDLGFIYRVIENETIRYLRVDEVFLSKCNKVKIKLSPLELVNKFAKKSIKIIEKEYTQLLPYGRYSSLEKTFFVNEHFNQ